MDENTIISLIGSLGFPIVVAGYFMTVLNKTLKNQTTMLEKLADCIERHFNKDE
jgi:hypothetical protein